MALTVTMAGSRASVQADDFSFDVSMSGAQALVSTPTKQAAVTFGSPRASVQWLSGKINNVCSSFMGISGPIFDPLVLSSYATGWTMGAAETLVKYYTHDLAASTDHVYDLGYYGSYLFYISKSGSCNRVFIDGTSSALSGSIFADPDYSNANIYRISVMSETIVYVLYLYDDGGGNKVRLAKLDYEANDRELIYSWDATVTYDGDTKTYWSTAWMARAKYGEKDYLVAPTQWLGDTGNALVRILVWDTTTDSQVMFDWNYVMNSADYIEFDDYNFATRPSMYQGRLCFTVMSSYYEEATSEMPYPSFVIDLADDSLTKITQSVTGADALPPHVYGSGLDQDTGIYYVWVAYNDATASPHDILKIDLTDASPNYAVSNSLDTPGKIIMGESQAWAGKFLTVPSRFQIYGPLPVYDSQNTTATNSMLFVDEANNVAWQIASTTNSINGYELSGGADKSITLNWDGAKFKYASSQAVHPLLMFDGLFVVVVYSRRTTPTPVLYQRELVIFGEEVV